MSIAYVSGLTWDTATACSLPVLTAPIPGVNVDYILEQDFMVRASDYTPLALNTPHPDYTNFILAEEGPRSDQGGEVFRWNRTYARIPSRHSQPSTVAYNFIGYGTTDSPAIIGRGRFNLSVAARIQFDYFLLREDTGNIEDSDGLVVYNGTPSVLPSVANIPSLQVQEYFHSIIGAVKLGILADTISYGPDATNPQTAYPTPDGTSDQPPYAAYPTREEYESWINKTDTVKTYDPDTNILTDTGIYEIVAIASQCSRWRGNIIERQTTYIRPQ